MSNVMSKSGVLKASPVMNQAMKINRMKRSLENKSAGSKTNDSFDLIDGNGGSSSSTPNPASNGQWTMEKLFTPSLVLVPMIFVGLISFTVLTAPTWISLLITFLLAISCTIYILEKRGVNLWDKVKSAFKKN